MAFEFPVRVYWEDTDAGGIVYYANYLKFFERARTEWLRAKGIGQQTLREHGGGMFVVSDAQIKYHGPARLDDELFLTVRLMESGRASLTIAQAAYLRPQGLSAAGQPQGAKAPSGGSAAREAANVGALSLSAAGQPQGAKAPSGGSAAREAASVGALLICEASIRIGWVQPVTLKPERIPSFILEALQ